MKNKFEQKIVVIYTGDETKAREKLSGQTIVDQMLNSVHSIRQNWSTNVEVIFIHTEPVSQQTQSKLAELKVTPLLANRKVSAEFPIANKFLVGEVYQGSKDILFLDCDTIVHQPPSFELSADLLVAFDALQDVSEERYRRLYKKLGVRFPTGDFTKKPSYEYYYNDRENLFPLINTGVYLIKNKYKDVFYKRLEENFQKTYELFKDEMTFYFDQICFAPTMLQLGLNYQYLPKGYNFICTPRAPYLKDWPKDKIFIEHYAGNNSRPLVFDGNKIDLIKSGII
jgi:hypothetical protein